MSPARGTRATRPTYADVQRWVHQHYGYLPQSAWIAHVKALSGLTLVASPNRRRRRRVPCPQDKQAHLAAALRHFGLITETARPPG